MSPLIQAHENGPLSRFVNNFKVPPVVWRGIGKTSLTVGILLAGAAGCGQWAEQGNMRDCAINGYNGDDPESDFAVDCEESFRINNDGNPDNDDAAYKSSETDDMNNMFAGGVGLAAAGLVALVAGLPEPKKS